MAYTERPAFFQFFQIVLLAIGIGLEGYAYTVDIEWQRELKKQNNFICLHLLHMIDKNRYSEVIQPMLEDNHKQYWDNGKVIQPSELTSDRNYFQRNIQRGSNSEKAAIGLISFSIIILIIHLICACVSDNYLYRTKWTAAAQGLVVFLCAFGAIFIAISAHNYEYHYEIMSRRFPECRILHLCKHADSDSEIEKFLSKNKFVNASTNAKKLLETSSVCQEFKMKIAAAAICGAIVGLCFVIICSAMDLTTLYDEEDVDEEERARRQALHQHALHAKRKMHKDQQQQGQAEEVKQETVPDKKSKKKQKNFSAGALSKA